MTQDQKRESIIKAARKRFIHFGVDKTTMNEIADDLSISKASLYYYFPDKLNLYAAVLQTIIQEAEDRGMPYLEDDNLRSGFNTYLEERTAFFINNYRILEYLKTIGNNIPEELQRTFSEAQQRDLVIITGFLKKKLRDNEAASIAELLNDCLNGLRMAVLNAKTNFFPEEEKFHDLLSREKEVVEIFLRGLDC